MDFSCSNLNSKESNTKRNFEFQTPSASRPRNRSILVLKTFCFAQFGKLSQFIREKSVCIFCSLTVCPLLSLSSKNSVGSFSSVALLTPKHGPEICDFSCLKHINIHILNVSGAPSPKHIPTQTFALARALSQFGSISLSLSRSRPLEN